MKPPDDVDLIVESEPLNTKGASPGYVMWRFTGRNQNRIAHETDRLRHAPTVTKAIFTSPREITDTNHPQFGWFSSVGFTLTS